MPAHPPDDLYFPRLQAIKGIDCSTPRCYANGFCTGVLERRAPLGWHIENG